MVVREQPASPPGLPLLGKAVALRRNPLAFLVGTRYVDDPDASQPERSAGDLAKRLPRCACMPFNTGPRICIGNQFVTMEGTLLLAEITQHYNLKPATNHQVMVKPSFTIRPKNGVLVTLEAR